jgi:site-specific recombinase XerD
MDPVNREDCTDTIERFLDRSWMLDGASMAAIKANRLALQRLDGWLQKHRVVALSEANAPDLRALLRSEHWDAVSRRCESLLGLVTRFFQSLRECKLRADDPVETLIDQELLVSASQRSDARVSRRDGPGHRWAFSGTPAH